MAMTRKRAALEVVEGTLEHGMPYLALGAGRPLVFLRWLTPDHANPKGWMRDAEITMLAPLARHFRVYAVNRAPGMAAGTTMADIAAEHAAALRVEFGGPVDVLGVSSGGSLALQLAVDHPDVMRRLVVAASGDRLEPATRAAQLRYAEAAAAGRRSGYHAAAATFSSPIQTAFVGAAMWLLDPWLRPKNPADLSAFVKAEDGFDVSGRLGEIVAPTLVVGGGRDAAYSMETFTRTADGIPNGRLVRYRSASHLGTVQDRRFAVDVVRFLYAADPLDDR